ncbi:MAG: hypothetical protein HY067_15925 [Betaproteobacteria bacterium]|nr:hypothetical protein [Betaproteobacteria bacterium]
MLPSADENDRQLRDQSSGAGFLYRYRDLVGPRAEWVRQIIVDSRVYFASPEKFNDPFDCRIRFRTDGSPDELRENLKQLLRKYGYSRQERRERMRKLGDPATFIRNVTEGFQREVNGTGILSLSSTQESILMWSYYASSHSGVCLQFRVVVDPPFFALAMPVTYVKELPVPNLLGNDRNERAQQLLMTKTEEWVHEREWRMLEPDRGPEARVFPTELLSAIILGAKIDEADKDRVLSWVAQRSIPLPVYQAVLDVPKNRLAFELLG